MKRSTPRTSTDHSALLTETAELVRSHRFDLAIAAFQQFVHRRPDDAGTAEILADLLLRGADAATARGECGEALAYLSVVANWRVARGDEMGAADLRIHIERLELAFIEQQLAEVQTRRSQDRRSCAAQARVCVARGDAVAAAEFLTSDMADGEPGLLLTIAEIQLRGGRFDAGMALVEQVIAVDASLTEAVAVLGVEVAAREPNAGFLLVEMAADAWVARSQWRDAIAAFQQFVEHVPNYPPALVRLRALQTAAASEQNGIVVPFRRARSA